MHNTINQLQLIFETIKNNPGIGLDELLKRLSLYKSPITTQELLRNITILGEKYGVEVVKDAVTEGYHILSENETELNTFESFARNQVLGGMLNDMLLNGVRVWDVVDLDDQAPLLNPQHLRQLIEAIVARNRVRITYRKFFEKTNEAYELEPQFIRQSQKRWYLVAGDCTTTPPTIKQFGLERVISVEHLPTQFKPSTKAIKERFKGVYGVSEYYKERVHVVLQTNHYQGKYFETLPVHKSQQVEYLPNDVCMVRLYLVLNKELLQLLVAQLQTIKIIAPKELKEEYRAYLEKKLKDLD